MVPSTFCPQRRVLAVIRGKITALRYDYSGSWDIPIDWLEYTGLFPFQKIGLVNPNEKSFSLEPTVYTYVLPAPRGSGCMNANGGIAHYFEEQGDVIIQGYGTYIHEASLELQIPVFLDARKWMPDVSVQDTFRRANYPDWIDFVSGKLHFACVTALITQEREVDGDVLAAQEVLRYVDSQESFQWMGQPVCVLSQDMADCVGFQSYEAVSLYPANGSPRFNCSMMCCVVPGLTNTVVIMGDGLQTHIHSGHRVVICRYTSLSPSQIYSHTAKVHLLNECNKTELVIEYRMADYIFPDLSWVK